MVFSGFVRLNVSWFRCWKLKNTNHRSRSRFCRTIRKHKNLRNRTFINRVSQRNLQCAPFGCFLFFFFVLRKIRVSSVSVIPRVVVVVSETIPMKRIIRDLPTIYRKYAFYTVPQQNSRISHIFYVKIHCRSYVTQVMVVSFRCVQFVIIEN